MVILRRMREDEFPAYSEYFIDDYGQDIAENYGQPIEVALALAKKDLDSFFPKGPDSSEHSLLCIDTLLENQQTLIGYLWHCISATEASTFIYDFTVFPEYRNSGFGRQAMSELEKQLFAEGINQIKLRVAYHNERALKLYKEIGFSITGFNMSKSISAQSL